MSTDIYSHRQELLHRPNISSERFTYLRFYTTFFARRSCRKWISEKL